MYIDNGKLSLYNLKRQLLIKLVYLIIAFGENKMTEIINLRVNHSSTPIGVDTKCPRFSWEIKSTTKNTFQEWYQVKVSEYSDFSLLVWDSGKVDSQETFDVEYKGDALKKDTKYFYSVTCGINDEEYSSYVAHFITGTLGSAIDAKWISPQEINYHEAETCPMIRKSFSVNSGDINYVTLQIHAFGLYELYINGKRPDDRLLAPAYSAECKDHIRYDVYEITDLIKQGNNAIALFLGDGYNGDLDIWGAGWEGRKKLTATINIHYTDGRIEKIITDDTWKYNYNSPIVTNGIYNGEVYDATKEIDGWNLPEFDDSSWDNVYYAEEVKGAKWKGWIAPRVRITEYLEPKKIYDLKNGRYIIDFGQNTAGFVRFSLTGKRGTSVRLRFAEELRTENNKLDLDIYTNRNAKNTDTYIFKGDGIETYQPHFTFHGFRYMEIAGLSRKPQKSEFVSCAISADFEGEARFQTDNALINRMEKNALWSFKSNNFTFTADCPQRDERLNCAIDFFNAHAYGLYAYDICSFCESWLNFCLDRETGFNRPTSMSYDASFCVLFWNLYKTYGNSNFIKENYQASKAFLENRYLKYYPNFEGGESFGDWCAPHIPGDHMTSFSSTKEVEIFTAIKAIEAVANMAELLGKKADEEKYRALVKKGIEIYNKLFYNTATKRYSNGKQTPNIIALMHNFVPTYDRKEVERNLIRSINANGNRHDVGVHGARQFIECLSDMGAVDLALDCFTYDGFPSFKYQIDHGATTIWEQWYERGDMDSHNHQMFGGAMSGFYSRLAGITPLEPGYRVVGIKPYLTKHINKLKSSVKTVCGNVDVQWEKKEDMFTISVNIPANCTAIVTMPNGETHSIGNGKFKFECNI